MLLILIGLFHHPLLLWLFLLVLRLVQFRLPVLWPDCVATCMCTRHDNSPVDFQAGNSWSLPPSGFFDLSRCPLGDCAWGKASNWLVVLTEECYISCWVRLLRQSPLSGWRRSSSFTSTPCALRAWEGGFWCGIALWTRTRFAPLESISVLDTHWVIFRAPGISSPFWVQTKDELTHILNLPGLAPTPMLLSPLWLDFPQLPSWACFVLAAISFAQHATNAEICDPFCRGRRTWTSDSQCAGWNQCFVSRFGLLRHPCYESEWWLFDLCAERGVFWRCVIWLSVRWSCLSCHWPLKPSSGSIAWSQVHWEYISKMVRQGHTVDPPNLQSACTALTSFWDPYMLTTKGVVMTHDYHGWKCHSVQILSHHSPTRLLNGVRMQAASCYKLSGKKIPAAQQRI